MSANILKILTKFYMQTFICLTCNEHGFVSMWNNGAIMDKGLVAEMTVTACTTTLIKSISVVDFWQIMVS